VVEESFDLNAGTLWLLIVITNFVAANDTGRPVLGTAGAGLALRCVHLKAPRRRKRQRHEHRCERDDEGKWEPYPDVGHGERWGERERQNFQVMGQCKLPRPRRQEGLQVVVASILHAGVGVTAESQKSASESDVYPRSHAGLWKREARAPASRAKADTGPPRQGCHPGAASRSPAGFAGEGAGGWRERPPAASPSPTPRGGGAPRGAPVLSYFRTPSPTRSPAAPPAPRLAPSRRRAAP
jgi:hypothetical protein